MERSASAAAPNETLLRKDLTRSLLSHSINPLTLSPFQRILLTTDGTVTEILEAFAGESMRVVKLSQEVSKLEQAISNLELPWGNRVLRRNILLQGRMSLMNFIYAESVIAVDRLPEGVRDGLLNSKKPIGLLILENRIETFKEILDCGKSPAGHLGGFFRIEESSPVIFRTYRMITGGRPIMMITEKFPETYFRGWDPTAEPRGERSGAGSGEASGSSRDRLEPSTVIHALEQFIRTQLLAGRRQEPIQENEDLLDGGLVDSVGFFQLLDFVTQRFGRRFPDEELVADNFRTLATIAERIIRKSEPTRSPES